MSIIVWTALACLIWFLFGPVALGVIFGVVALVSLCRSV